MRESTSRARRNAWLVATAVATTLALSPTAARADGTGSTNEAPPDVSVVQCNPDTSVIIAVPSSDFDPLTATDDELVANGLPTRPTDPADLDSWTTFVTSPIRQGTSCPVTIPGEEHTQPMSGAASAGPTSADNSAPAQDPPTAPDGSVSPDTAAGCPSNCLFNWAGNVATGHNYGSVQATWVVPGTSTDSTHSDALMSAWVGIGQGSSSNPLLQAGSESDPGKNPYLWWEAVPHNAIQKVVGILAGDKVHVFVNYANGTVSYSFYDYTENYSTTIRYNVSGTPTTAEWVAERTQVGTYPYLAKWSTLRFTGSVASYGSSGNKSIASLSHHYDNMVTCNDNTLMAYPGALASNGTDFSVYWRSYGDNHVCG